MSTSELAAAGPEQLRFAGSFEAVAGERGWWLAFPAGRRARHAERRPDLALCLGVRDAGARLDVLLAELRALAPRDAEIVVVVGGSRDWTLARCLRAAAADERLVVHPAAGAVPEDALAVAALGLAAAPLALHIPARARVGEDVVTALRDALDHAPAALAAVAASATSAGAALAPWSGVGYVYGPDAAAGALTAPLSALLGRPALVRAERFRAAGAAGSLRDALVAACARGDVVGVPAALVLQPEPDAPDPPTLRTLGRAVASADAVARDLRDGALVSAAARAVADALARLPEAEPAALRQAAGALERLSAAASAAAAAPPATDLRRFHPGVPPLPLDVRGFSFVCPFRWAGHPPHDLETIIGAYLATFAPGDPVTLVLRGELSTPAAAAQLEAWLAELITGTLGRTLDAIPDVLVEVAPLDADQRAALYAAVDCAIVLPGTEAHAWAREAMGCGVPVVAGGAGEVELITAATGFPAGPAGLVAALRAAAGDPAGCARRGAAARAAMTARAL